MFLHHQFMLFLLLSCSDWIDSKDPESVVPKPRVWSGEDVPKGKWPFMAEMRWNENDNKNGHLCGGAVLNDDTIITTAHCLKFHDVTPDKVRIYLGETVVVPVNKDQLYEVNKFILHPSSEGNNLGIGLIKLRRKIDFNAGLIAKVCLAGPNTQPDTSKCVSLGWGLTEPGKNSEDRPAVLQQVNIPIVPCIGDHPGLICAGYYDKPAGICSGDGGGPLLCPPIDDPNIYLLFGVLSVGFADCGQAPDGFHSVANILDWIQQNAEAEV